MRPLALLTAAGALALPAAAHALPSPVPLPHVYLGVQGGPGSRIETDARGDHSRDHDVNFGGFAGVEMPAGLAYFAAEADLGGATGHVHTTADLGDGTEFVHAKPQWNWDATARAGLAPFPGLAAYLLAGYGGERVHFSDEAGGDDHGWLKGLVYGVGARYHLGSTGVRLEWRQRQTGGHWDPHAWLGGVFVRF